MHLDETNRVQVSEWNDDDNWDLMNPRFFYVNVIYDYMPLRGVFHWGLILYLSLFQFFGLSAI